ncbi:MAG: hypothetical protein L0G70_00300 [Rubrobacter sp.]|nr:hypothetical protein [Rubrobacter sp.]
MEDVDVLNLRLSGTETVLPVFDLEDRAGMSLWLEALDEGWQVQEFSVAELASVLCGPCASVERVLLNPFSAGTAERAGVSREDFLRVLAGERACPIESRSMVGPHPNAGSTKRRRP